MSSALRLWLALAVVIQVALPHAQRGSPRAAGSSLRLIDVAAQAGLDLVNVSGGPNKDFIVDANGNGAAFFDYDRDGDLDALLVSGSTRERFFGGSLSEALDSARAES